MANNFQYEVSQSFTGSFSTKDTIEFSFQAMVNTTRARFHSQHFVDIYYSSSDSSGFQRIPSTDLITFNGDLKVGKRFLNETYTSLVLYYKEKDKILVTNIDGPLKHLQNEWKFKEINNQTQLEFDIDFELKNNLLNMIMKNSFNLGLNKIADAFEERAIKLFNNS